MSGRRRSRAPERGAPPRRPWRPGRAWLAASLAVAIVAVAAAVLVRWRGGAPAPGPAPVPPADMHALVDSVWRAEARHDWSAALAHVQRIADAEPGNATALMALGKEWSNYAWAGDPYGRDRGAQRSSLQRIRIMRHALALEDSASRLAQPGRERSQVGVQWGRLLELMGLPLDALARYSDAFAADSTNPTTRERIVATGVALRAHAAGADGPPTPGR